MKPPLVPQIDMTETVKSKDGERWITQLTQAGRAEVRRREEKAGLVRESFEIGNGLRGYRYTRAG